MRLISELVVEVIGEAALELVPGDATRLRLAVAACLEVDGLPPLGIGASVRERVEHSLLRRVDVPFVDEHVFRCHARYPLVASGSYMRTWCWIGSG